ncbi:insecticidal delta-endotoxin Cry8Ea1 family protein [Flavobacteriaceae bacterium]|nr:insecticidal delta-endotoxin Cry8Ea1 family protein [Flavobacteriaceae bacterium]
MKNIQFTEQQISENPVDKFATQQAINEIVSDGFGRVPEFGWILSGCLKILLPEGQNAPAITNIIATTEALIDKKIQQNDITNLKEKFNGLRAVLNDFLNATSASSRASYWRIVYSQFQLMETTLMLDDTDDNTIEHKIIRLPLFAQFANLYLPFLKQAVVFGKEWQMDTAEINKTVKDLNTNITTYCSYVDSCIKEWPKHIQTNAKFNPKTAEWNARIQFIRDISFMVLDSRFHWPYIGKSTPTDVPVSTNEIYSDIIGSITNNPNFKIPEQTHRLTGLKVWGGDLIDAIQTRYGTNKWGNKIPEFKGNPGGGGTTTPPQGWTGIIHIDNPFVSYSATSRTNVPESFTLTFNQGQTISCGSRTSSDIGKGSYKNKIISQIITSGGSVSTLTAESLIFGFRDKNSYESDRDLCAITKKSSNFVSIQVYHRNSDYQKISELVNIPHPVVENIENPNDCKWYRGTYKKDNNAVFAFFDECLQFTIFSASTQKTYLSKDLEDIWSANEFQWHFALGTNKSNSNAVYAFLQKRRTDTIYAEGNMSLQVLDDSYSKVVQKFEMPIPNKNGDNFNFHIGSYQNDPCALFCIKTKNTDSKHVELHISSSVSKLNALPYSGWKKHLVLSNITEAEGVDYLFQLEGTRNNSSILYCIKIKNTKSKFVEITTLIGDDYSHVYLQEITSIPISHVKNYAHFFIGRGMPSTPPLD